MKKSMKRRAFDEIRKNIETYGFHVYHIPPGPCPRYIYTIGLHEKVGFEIILAGTAFIEDENADELVQWIAESLLTKKKSQRKFSNKLGRQTIEFKLTQADSTWSQLLILGATDYYKSPDIKAMSIVIEEKYRTIDCPNLKDPFDKTANSPWKWLEAKWRYPIPEESMAITNLNALSGKQLTEIASWENDTWAIFSGAGEKTPLSRIREVSLGTFLGIDPSLEFITRMKIDDGFWRDRGKSDWQFWK